MITEEQYIEVYDQIGYEYFCKGSDSQLIEWGNSEEEIKRIKVQAVKSDLKFYNYGIEIYKKLNELCGGSNSASIK